MNPFSTSSILLLAEAAVLFGGIILVYLFVSARRRRHERELVRRMVKKFRQEEEVRRETLAEVLREGCGHEDEAVQAISDSFNDREKALYNSFMRMYLGRERHGIKTLDDKVQSIVRGYQKLVMNEHPDSPEEERGAGQLPYTKLRKENETLRAELEALRKELNDAKLTTENIMKEYATMYAGGEREGELQVREELKKLHERDWLAENGEEAGEDPVAPLDASALEDDAALDVQEFSVDDENTDPAAT